MNEKDPLFLITYFKTEMIFTFVLFFGLYLTNTHTHTHNTFSTPPMHITPRSKTINKASSHPFCDSIKRLKGGDVRAARPKHFFLYHQ